MKRFETTRRVAHSAKNMFALVADIERYPEFLPLCKALKLQSRETLEGKEVLTADMTVAFKLFRETFTSRVTLDPETLHILVDYLGGPFRHLDNRWDFLPAGEEACDIEFYIAYEFSSRPLELMMGAVFEKAFGKFAESFEERANEIYGVPDQMTRPT
ncbi:MAG: type II toxin-antitoxin system RatA family toxin [Alphaproteobacteria bacterium]